MQSFFKKVLTVLIVITVCISNSCLLTNIFAKEESAPILDDYKDKTEIGARLDDNQEITTMDENGNIHPLKETNIIKKLRLFVHNAQIMIKY